MPNKKNAEPGAGEKLESTKWDTRIQFAREFREADGRKAAWTNMKAYYRNQFAKDVVSVPLLFAHGRQMVPFLYFNDPVVECTAIWKGWERKAKIQEAVDNMLLRKLRVKEQLKLIIQDSYLYDYGIRKIGYDSEFGYDPTGSLWAEIFAELGNPLSEDELLEYNTYILRESPFFLRVPPARFLVDPDTDGPGLETARWCVEEFYRPLKDVEEDDRYSIKGKLVASHTLNYSGGAMVISPVTKGQSSSGKRPNDAERIKLYEIWDKKDRKVYIKAEGYSGFLREQEDVWGLSNFFPYDRLCFNPVSDEHYSVSDAMYVERQQVEMNDIRTQEMQHRRKENIKILYKKGVFTDDQIERLKSGEIGAMVEAAAVGSLQDSVQVVTANMTRDIFKAADDIRGDFKEILAFGQNQMGQEMGRRKTASEAMLINQFVQLRGDERRDIIAGFLERAIGDINRLVYQFWDTQDIIQILGPDGNEFVEWDGEMIKGEYAIKILANSTLPMNKDLYKSQVKELFSMLSQSPYVKQTELHRLLLDSYEEFDTSRLLLPAPDMMQPLIDFRPGKGQRGEGGSEEGSRINMPENPGQVDMSHNAPGYMGQEIPTEGVA